MKVIVDTSVWSLALRRQKQPQNAYVDLLEELIADGRVVVLGVVRQEVLSGIRYKEQYEKLKANLRAFPDLSLKEDDYEVAASFYNKKKKKRIQGSNTDYLICSAAGRRNYQILTTDKDFDYFKEHLSVNLLKPGACQ